MYNISNNMRKSQNNYAEREQEIKSTYHRTPFIETIQKVS